MSDVDSATHKVAEILLGSVNAPEQQIYRVAREISSLLLESDLNSAYSVKLAYGLLWHAPVDKATSQGRILSGARDALLGVLSHEERGSGIEEAREWLARQPIHWKQELVHSLFGMADVEGTPAATMKEVVEVLEFYANPEIYKPHPHGLAFERRDKSDMARSLLARLGRG